MADAQAIEQITIANPEPLAAWGTSAHLARERWEPVGSHREGTLFCPVLEREGREPMPQEVRPVAEQARALGLRRVRGAAVPIWAGAFTGEKDRGG